MNERQIPATAAMINMCRRFEKIEGIQELLNEGKNYQEFHKEVNLKEITKPLMEIDVWIYDNNND